MDWMSLPPLDLATLEALAVYFSTKLVIATLLLGAAFLVGRLGSATATRALRDRRGGTLVPIVNKAIMLLAMILGAVMALDHLGVDVAALIAGAGILGLAVGFGAQSMVKDLITGFFLLLEDVLRVGDVATVGGLVGTVEEVGLRMTKIRAFDGQLWFVPNGEISTVGNFNREWTRAVVEVGLAYEQDVGRGLAVLQAIGDAYAAEFPDVVLEAPEAQGVMA